MTTAESARPAPIVLANIASHVRAPTILLNKSCAIRTRSHFNSSFIVGPAFYLILFTTVRIFAMVRLSTFFTNLILAFKAFYESWLLEGKSFFPFFFLQLFIYFKIDHLFTARLEAEHQVGSILSNSGILLVLFKSFENFRTHQFFNFLWCRHWFTAMLRAFEIVMAILLHYHWMKSFLKTFSAECVWTCL